LTPESTTFDPVSLCWRAELYHDDVIQTPGPGNPDWAGREETVDSTGRGQTTMTSSETSTHAERERGGGETGERGRGRIMGRAAGRKGGGGGGRELVKESRISLKVNGNSLPPFTGTPVPLGGGKEREGRERGQQ